MARAQDQLVRPHAVGLEDLQDFPLLEATRDRADPKLSRVASRRHGEKGCKAAQDGLIAKNSSPRWADRDGSKASGGDCSSNKVADQYLFITAMCVCILMNEILMSCNPRSYIQMN